MRAVFFIVALILGMNVTAQEKMGYKQFSNQDVFGTSTKDCDSMEITLWAPISLCLEYQDPFAVSMLEIYLGDSLVASSEFESPNDWIASKLKKKLPINNYRYIFGYCSKQYGCGDYEIKIQ